jgi:hypothetical protein
MGRELEGHGQGIDGPYQDDFPDSPGYMTLQHLFEGCCWFLAVSIVTCLQLSKHFIHGMKQDWFDVAAMGWKPLHHSDEIINIDIPGLDRWPGPALFWATEEL